jgi:hypothetical protein
VLSAPGRPRVYDTAFGSRAGGYPGTVVLLGQYVVEPAAQVRSGSGIGGGGRDGMLEFIAVFG